MRLQTPTGPVTLTYCTNIHPVHGVAALRRALDEHAIPLRDRLAGGESFALGLRLSDEESRELLEPGALESFRAFLDQQRLRIAGINGFPFGAFHDRRIKDDVYRPDWRDPVRLAYTNRLTRILAALTPTGAEAGVSTVPLSYKRWNDADDGAMTIMTARIADAAAALCSSSLDHGVDLHLDIEPEPDCTLETSAEFVRWFQTELTPLAVAAIQRAAGLSASEAEDELRRRIAVCLDACHAAVEYEDAGESLDRYQSAGVRIGRVQVSSALRVPIPADQRRRADLGERLAPYGEDTYLHQVIEQRPRGDLRRLPDLSEALPSLPSTDALEWRIHFHTPVFTDEMDGLTTTQPHLRDLLHQARRRDVTTLYEVETYTWSVLPAPLRLGLTDSIERELRWTIEALTTPG